MLRLDHLIIAVDDLATAIADYQHLGFTVSPGGVHANGATHNALIVFADGSYLELLALTGQPPENDAADYSFLLQHGAGFVGYALQSDDWAADMAGLKTRGCHIAAENEGGRQRPDGTTLRWRTALIEDGQLTPFFIEDVTPRHWRVPDTPAATTHANGVRGVCEVIFYVADLAEAVERYAAITGGIPQRRSSGTLFLLADCVLTVKQLAPEILFDADIRTGNIPVRATLYAAVGILPELPKTDSRQTHGATFDIITESGLATQLLG